MILSLTLDEQTSGIPLKLVKSGAKEPELDESEREEPELDEPGCDNLKLNESGREGSEKCKTGVDKPGEKVLTCSVGAPHAIMPRRTRSGGRRGGNFADSNGVHADDIE